MDSCEMYQMFAFAGTVETWKIRYCKNDHQSCARWKLASQGVSVPLNLLPNGKLLQKKKK